MGHDRGNAVVCLNTTFEDHSLVTVDNEGAVLWMAPQISRAMGYEAHRLGTLVRTDWAEDFVEGVEFRKATRHELVALKAAGAIAKNTPSLLLLTESGVNLAAILSRRKLRSKRCANSSCRKPPC